MTQERDTFLPYERVLARLLARVERIASSLRRASERANERERMMLELLADREDRVAEAIRSHLASTPPNIRALRTQFAMDLPKDSGPLDDAASTEDVLAAAMEEHAYLQTAFSNHAEMVTLPDQREWWGKIDDLLRALTNEFSRISNSVYDH